MFRSRAESPRACHFVNMSLRVPELSLASLRSMTQRAKLTVDVQFSSVGANPSATDAFFIGAPHVFAGLQNADRQRWRGMCDCIAQRINASDLQLFETQNASIKTQILVSSNNAYSAQIACFVFDCLEQYRVEALAPISGMRLNIQSHYVLWLHGLADAGLLETEQGLLLITVLCVAQARISGFAIDENLEDRIESTRGQLVPIIGAALRELRDQIGNQQRFGDVAIGVAVWCANRLASFEALTALAESTGAKPRSDRFARQAFYLPALSEPTERTDLVSGSAPGDQGRHVQLQAAMRYQVFTREFDTVNVPEQQSRLAQLKQWRAQLDTALHDQQLNLPRLARDIARALCQQVHLEAAYAQEQGRIDGRRLAGLVASPSLSRVYIDQHVSLAAEVSVSILIDCSGSMKNHTLHLAMLVDFLARALSAASIPFEVLGHTTGAWNGGRAAKAWRRSGARAGPGRLNELSLTVFKSFQNTWRASRIGLGALLRHDLYRESCEGEALQWACERARAESTRRSLVVVITDASPMDSATCAANSQEYLSQHLDQVILEQADAGTSIVALAFGDDLTTVSDHYAHACSFQADGTINNSSFQDFLNRVVRAL